MIGIEQMIANNYDRLGLIRANGCHEEKLVLDVDGVSQEVVVAFDSVQPTGHLFLPVEPRIRNMVMRNVFSDLEDE